MAATALLLFSLRSFAAVHSDFWYECSQVAHLALNSQPLTLNTGSKLP